ncbi:MAG: hypothetical protein IPO87_19450 [Flavobacteriales bacterium]|nr:hypothetical protein [Flavobacteriales bacterium]
MERVRLKEVLYSSDHIRAGIRCLLAPPYDQVNQVTVSEMNELNANLQISTGKRLGFRFQADGDDPS